MTPKLKLLIVLLAFVFVALVLMSSSAFQQWRSDDQWQPLLPMTFAHSDHKQEKCIDCHHNFVDQTGNDQCLLCHQSEPAIKLNIEQQFHQLCRGCHQQRQAEGEPHGPLRACAACHTSDAKP